MRKFLLSNILLLIFFCSDAFAQDSLGFGGSYTFNPVVIIPGEPLFNYFFTLVLVFGFVSVLAGIVTRIFSKS